MSIELQKFIYGTSEEFDLILDHEIKTQKKLLELNGNTKDYINERCEKLEKQKIELIEELNSRLFLINLKQKALLKLSDDLKD